MSVSHSDAGVVCMSVTQSKGGVVYQLYLNLYSYLYDICAIWCLQGSCTFPAHGIYFFSYYNHRNIYHFYVKLQTLRLRIQADYADL